MCSVSSRDADRHVIRVRPQETTDTRQGLPYFLGICETTSHARGLGDFLFIPPGVPHQALNLSTTERAVGLVARNDSSEQENVVLYDPLTSQRTD
jgi:uncharacterized RmlC-like cupin family protein